MTYFYTVNLMDEINVVSGRLGGRKGAAMAKFLSDEDRLIIAKCLQENASFGESGKELGKERIVHL